MLIFKTAFFQSAYTYWLCSIRLPLYLRHQDTSEEHKVEACQEVCLDVEKKCPFQVKEKDTDRAAGNPSFICEGNPK